MVFILEKRLESTQGATLRYIGILGRDFIETLKFDPQIDGIKIRVWLLIEGAEFGRCCSLFLMHEIGRSIQASLSLPYRSQNTVQVHGIKSLVLIKTILILTMWMSLPKSFFIIFSVCLKYLIFENFFDFLESSSENQISLGFVETGLTSD